MIDYKLNGGQMKLVLNREQYDKMVLVSKACSKDKTINISLTFIKYNAEKKHIVAINGHIMRVEAMDLGDKDLLIPADILNYTVIQLKRMNNEIPLSFEESDENYPDYERVIPNSEATPIPAIGLNMDVMTDFAKTFPKNTNLKLEFFSETSAIKIFQYTLKDDDFEFTFAGVIMPTRMPIN